jgi:HK97 family phage portal protein
MGFNIGRALEASGKALGPHPAFMDGTRPVSIYSPGKSREDAVLSQRTALRHADSYGGTQAIDWVYDCVNLYADAASSATYTLTKPDGTKLVPVKTKGTPPDYEVGPKALYDLLDKPNPYMLYDELVSLLVIDLLLVGNGYWYKWNDGSPAMALYRLAPAYVKVIPDPTGPKSYEYQPPGAKKPLKISPDQIIHFRRPNPHSAYYGMGVIQGSGRAMDLELAITDTQASFFENNAAPSLIIQSERRVPRDVFVKLRAQLRSRTAGSQNAGEMLLLESGLKAETMSSTAQNAMFDVLSRMSRDRILAKFRVSPLLLGILDENSGSNKVSDVQRQWDQIAAKPFLDRLSGLITAGVAESFGVNFQIQHASVLPADEAIKVGESIATLPGIKIREVRRQYVQFGIEESTGDPALDELVINLPGENMNADGQGVNGGQGGADQPIGTEPGRPALPQNTSAIGHGSPGGAVASGKSLVMLDGHIGTLQEVMAARAAETGQDAKSLVSAAEDTIAELRRMAASKPTAEVEGKALDPLGDENRSYDQKLSDYMHGKSGLTELDALAELVLSGAIKFDDLTEDDQVRLTMLGNGYSIKAITNAAGERVTVGNVLQGEQRPQDPYARARSIDINESMSIMEAGLKDAVADLERSLLDHVEGKALKTSDLVSRVRNSAAWKTFRERVKGILADGVARSAQAGVMHSGLTPDGDIDYDTIAQDIINRPEGLNAIVKTLKERVVKHIKDARTADAERQDYQQVISSVISDWTTNQASLIADSEATEAYNEATLVAAEMSDVTNVYVVEEEDAPDAPCQEARGQIWDIAHAREHRKEHPRCRRAFLPLTEPAVS